MAVNVATLVWISLALVLIVEGLLPFLSPSLWRRMVKQVAQLRDDQIRTAGLVAVAAGLAILMVAT